MMGRKKTTKTASTKTAKTAKKPSKGAAKPMSSKTKKTIMFGGAGLLVLIVLFAVLMKAGVLSGKAIQTQYAFEESKPFVCTPPHIETVGGCCLDNNKNNI